MTALTRLRTVISASIGFTMFSRTRLTLALAGALFLAACAYVGYANEILKNAVSSVDRAILMMGFLLGAGAVSRWIMVLDIKRNMRRIKRARSNRGNGS